MTDSTTTPLSEVKRFDALGLPREVMTTAGPAAQTFAALRTLARNTGETFASIRIIAERACLEPRTVKNHLYTLGTLSLVKNRGRRGRRTATNCIDLWFLGANDKAKFAILPRWAAKLLPTWAERAVFALIISRDSLNEAICDEPGYQDCDLYGRLQYPASTLAKDSGLSLRAIAIAKQKLAERKIIKIDPAMYWQDDFGRIRTMADTLYLNPDFEVGNHLLDRCAKVSLSRPERDTSVTPDHSAEVSLEERKSFPDLAQKFPGGGAKVSLLHKGTIKSIPNSSLKRTSAVADGSPPEGRSLCFPEEKKTNEEKSNAIDLSAISTDERKLQLAEKLKAMLDENGEVRW